MNKLPKSQLFLNMMKHKVDLGCSKHRNVWLPLVTWDDAAKYIRTGRPSVSAAKAVELLLQETVEELRQILGSSSVYFSQAPVPVNTIPTCFVTTESRYMPLTSQPGYHPQGYQQQNYQQQNYQPQGYQQQGYRASSFVPEANKVPSAFADVKPSPLAEGDSFDLRPVDNRGLVQPCNEEFRSEASSSKRPAADSGEEQYATTPHKRRKTSETGRSTYDMDGGLVKPHSDYSASGKKRKRVSEVSAPPPSIAVKSSTETAFDFTAPPIESNEHTQMQSLALADDFDTLFPAANSAVLPSMDDDFNFSQLLSNDNDYSQAQNHNIGFGGPQAVSPTIDPSLLLDPLCGMEEFEPLLDDFEADGVLDATVCANGGDMLALMDC